MLAASTLGAPNWVDLSTPDPDGAARFYTDLFGWRVDTVDSPVGPYRIARVGDREVGGMMAPSPGEDDMPPMWTVFIHVADVDATVDRVVDADGVVLESPFELPGGRIAVVSDPSGAMFGIISVPTRDGVWLSSEHGSICWVELLTRTASAPEPFYTAVFGWKPETVAAAGTWYTTFWLEGERVAGMMSMPDTVPAEVPSYWGVYVAVADCNAVAARTTELGGEVLLAPMTVGEDEFAALADPWGATFSIMTTPGSDTFA